MVSNQLIIGIALIISGLLIMLISKFLGKMPDSRFLYKGGTHNPGTKFWFMLGILALVIGVIFLLLSLIGIIIPINYK